MSDLISRSELLKRFLVNKDGHRIPERDCDNLEVTVSIKDVKTIIKDQPTAYDVDKVVEKLEWEIADMNFCEYRDAFIDAIEIVKQGGTGTETETIRDKAIKWNNNSSKRVPYAFIDYVEGKREISVPDDVCERKENKGGRVDE